ncbi:shikimate dehydrogenase [Lutibacter sp. TH_r2]|uniref:shikimate dehydrogenase family protein n=1 Tax=Lutibacter sp. TH_r2 TaxID=3082083 RepID=UPI002954BF26|nr:shikimate dehydrogenase [Lutibacter sp. TH_r2]MDV7187176.1 shikimate dehydrogenase [Lutibacter sp. TH_r2]
MKKFKFGLLGKDISYSFSRKYFSEKFEKLGLTNLKYVNFDIPEIEEFPFLYYQQEEDFGGINVTIPYKQAVMRYMDEIDEDAEKIGAVNTIKFTDNYKLIGYNTDFYGFKNSIKPLLKPHHTKALILGTGGASKAIAYAFSKLNIEVKFVSRRLGDNNFLYSVLNEEILKEYTVIVNCSPVGTFPNTTEAPDIPYKFITQKHLLYDLIYNPEKTQFLLEGEKNGAQIKNGLEMLELQAEKSWEIWNS